MLDLMLDKHKTTDIDPKFTGIPNIHHLIIIGAACIFDRSLLEEIMTIFVGGYPLDSQGALKNTDHPALQALFLAGFCRP